MIATASAEDYRRTLRALADADVCDSILAIFVPPLGTQASEVAAAIRQAAEIADGATVAAVFMTSEGAPAEPGRKASTSPGTTIPRTQRGRSRWPPGTANGVPVPRAV